MRKRPYLLQVNFTTRIMQIRIGGRFQFGKRAGIIFVWPDRAEKLSFEMTQKICHRCGSGTVCYKGTKLCKFSFNCMPENSRSKKLVSNKCNLNKQSASELSRTQKSWSIDFGPVVIGRWTTALTSMGNPITARCFRWQGFKSSFWVCFSCHKY